MHNTLRRAAAPTAAVVLATGAITLAAAPASAHVTVTPSTTVAGEYALLTFSVPHGCDGSATTKLAIDIPDGINVVTPTINQGWTVEKQTEPVKGQSEETDRVSRVIYTAKKPLPDGYRDAFELDVPLPVKAGRTLTFPTTQTCVKGTTEWNEVPKAGQSEDDLEAPAPAFELTAADDSDDPTEASDDVDSDASDSTDESEAEDSDGGDGLAWTGIVVGIAGLAVGGTALARTRSRG